MVPQYGTLFPPPFHCGEEPLTPPCWMPMVPEKSKGPKRSLKPVLLYCVRIRPVECSNNSCTLTTVSLDSLWCAAEE